MCHRRKRHFLIIGLAILLFLCAAPAVSRAARQRGSLPPPDSFLDVKAGTEVKDVYKFLHLSGDVTIVVKKADGSIRAGPLETGDQAVLSDSEGDELERVGIRVGGGPSSKSPVPSEPPSSKPEAPSSKPPVPSKPPSSKPEAPSSKPPVSSEPPSSKPEAPSSKPPVSSELPVSSGSEVPPKAEKTMWDSPVPVSSLYEMLLSGPDLTAAHIVVTLPDGTERTGGLLCTGDTIRVFNPQGRLLRIFHAAIAGDLTRCGKPTEEGCRLLYSCLTGNSNLSQEFFAAADMNRDGTVDAGDLLTMKQRLSSAPEKFRPGS